MLDNFERGQAPGPEIEMRGQSSVLPMTANHVRTPMVQKNMRMHTTTMGQTLEARPRMLYLNRSMHLEKYTKYAPVEATMNRMGQCRSTELYVRSDETHRLREAGTTDR